MPETPTMHSAAFTRITLALASSLAALLPLGAQPVTKDPAPARETPPPIGTPRDFRLPQTREFTLSNGLQVTLVPFGRVPKATIRLAVRTGNIDEKANEIWLSNVTAEMMNEGTTSRSATQIAEQMAAMGGSVSVSAGNDLSNVNAEVLSERAADAVRMVADVARNPLFPPSEFPRIRANRLRQVAVAKSQPQQLANERFLQVLYGDHPYGRVFPTEAMLQAYTIEQVKAFHAANWGAQRSHLYVAGVFDQAAVERAIREAFGDWARGAAPTNLPANERTQKQVALIDRPNAVQSTVYLGIPVAPPASADYTGLLVTNQILGGAFGSRITSNIREQKGYTYSPFSQVATRRGEAYWVEVADVTTNVTGASLTEIFKEIDRMRNEPVPAAELKAIQNNMAGVFTLQNGSRAGIIGQLAFKDLQGLGNDYLTGYVRRVLAITPADVQRIAQQYLVPNRMALVVVGDKKTVEEQLAPWSTVAP
jgi:zinc protease